MFAVHEEESRGNLTMVTELAGNVINLNSTTQQHQPVQQVWSPTQFSPVDFKQSRIGVRNCVFKKKPQSRFASAVLDGVHGPLCLEGHSRVFMILFSSESKVLGRLRALEGTRVNSKRTLWGSETETRKLLGGTKENSVSLMRGHWIALQANQWFFTKRKQKKI